MPESVDIPERSLTHSILAFTINEDDIESLKAMSDHLNVLCWNPQSGSVVELEISTETLNADELISVEFNEQVHILKPTPVKDEKFLTKQAELEATARDKLGPDQVLVHFEPLDDHQKESEELLGSTAIHDTDQAWAAIKAHLPGFPHVRDNFGRWGDTEHWQGPARASYRLAMIALLAIKILRDDHPFEGDDRVQGLLAVARAVEVGRYHQRLVLEGYSDRIREIAAESVPGTAV